MSVTYDPLVAKGLGQLHFSGSTTHSTGACLIGSSQLLSTSAAVFGCHPWYFYLQYAGVFSAAEAVPSPMTSPDLSPGILTLPHRAKPQFLSMTSSNLGYSLQLRLYLHRWPPPISHSANPQLLSWPLHVFKARTTWETHTCTKFGFCHKIQPWAQSATIFVC